MDRETVTRPDLVEGWGWVWKGTVRGGGGEFMIWLASFQLVDWSDVTSSHTYVWNATVILVDCPTQLISNFGILFV